MANFSDKFPSGTSSSAGGLNNILVNNCSFNIAEGVISNNFGNWFYPGYGVFNVGGGYVDTQRYDITAYKALTNQLYRYIQYLRNNTGAICDTQWDCMGSYLEGQRVIMGNLAISTSYRTDMKLVSMYGGGGGTEVMHVSAYPTTNDINKWRVKTATLNYAGDTSSYTLKLNNYLRKNWAMVLPFVIPVPADFPILDAYKTTGELLDLGINPWLLRVPQHNNYIARDYQDTTNYVVGGTTDTIDLYFRVPSDFAGASLSATLSQVKYVNASQVLTDDISNWSVASATLTNVNGSRFINIQIQRSSLIGASYPFICACDLKLQC